MTKVKICGLTLLREVEYVNACLPDYIGFVFAKSKRRVTIETALKLMAHLDRRIKVVGVFVNEPMESLIKTAINLNLAVIQLSGDEAPSYVETVKEQLNTLYQSGNSKETIKIWKAFHMRDHDSLKLLEDYQVDAFLLDTYQERSYGGSGRTFNWELAKEAAESRNIVLAGGLTPQNVEQALDTVHPFAVDVSSGVEGSDGKDLPKINTFISTIRNHT